jgi:hypothetical protein
MAVVGALACPLFFGILGWQAISKKSRPSFQAGGFLKSPFLP